MCLAANAERKVNSLITKDLAVWYATCSPSNSGTEVTVLDFGRVAVAPMGCLPSADVYVATTATHPGMSHFPRSLGSPGSSVPPGYELATGQFKLPARLFHQGAA